MSEIVTLNRTHLIECAKDKPLKDVVITDLRKEAKDRVWKSMRATIEDGDEAYVLKDRNMAKSDYSFLQQAPIVARLDTRPELATDGTEFINAGVAQDIACELLPDGYEMQFKADRRDGVIKSHVVLTNTRGVKENFDVATADELRAAIRAFITSSPP